MSAIGANGSAKRGGRVNRSTPVRDGSPRENVRLAAVEVFYERGYAAASIREIAARLGMQGGSIYNHYESKQDILFEIMSGTNHLLIEGIREALADAVAPVEKLRVAVIHHVIFHCDWPHEAFLAESELRNLEPAQYREIIAERRAYERIFEELLREGQDAGVFVVKDVRVLTYAIIAACSAVATWFKPRGALKIEEIAEVYADFVLNGVC